MKQRPFTGTKTQEIQEYEIAHRKIAREAAAEGIVLLKNENGLLPLDLSGPVALYGAGAGKTIKGGTGSGDVNERYSVSIYEGLEKAGFQVTTGDWICDFEKRYNESREAWKEAIWKDADADDGPNALFDAYTDHQYAMPAGRLPEDEDAVRAKTAIYVLSRIAGEGRDRREEEGDYYLSAEETQIVEKICALYSHVVLILNVGGPVDLSFSDSCQNIEAILMVSQPGCEGGNAVADVLSGSVSPSGKLTDSWAYRYADYPNAQTFSHRNHDVETEKYEEGIYVGYRYFDTFQVPVRYGFGYGLSYTDFEIRFWGISHYDLGTDHPEIGVKVQVRNTGSKKGKEVVQIYVSCPWEGMEKEYRRLVGFAKTEELEPGEMQELEIRFPVYGLTSYQEQIPGWVLEKGWYGIAVGNSLQNAAVCAAVQMTDDMVMVKTQNICPLQMELKEKKAPADRVSQRRKEWLENVEKLPSLILSPKDMISWEVIYGTEYYKLPEKEMEFVDQLSLDQLVQLVTGDPDQGQGNNLGAAGISVPGSAAQTSACAKGQDLADISLADGPAGLRLARDYCVLNGEIVREPFEKSIEGGFLSRDTKEKQGEIYYQYCTAFPVGTALAQTWNTALLQKVGKAVAEEMQIFQVTLWLAPGMNIHRNPLCGRNFEYYSEDPVVSGKMAAAITKGVQSEKGCGTTIKHFACNNQEDNRMNSDSVLSERTLREIYLKGFEIAVKESQPMSIMTSYNLINGIHAANNHDICTKAARNEWDFKGVIMTDWTTTHGGEDCTASGCMRAGNDLVMPGILQDHENIRMELEAGTLEQKDLKKSVCRLVETVWKSNMYE